MEKEGVPVVKSGIKHGKHHIPLDQMLLSKKRPPQTSDPIEELGPARVKLISYS